MPVEYQLRIVTGQCDDGQIGHFAAVRPFEERKVRTVWDDRSEEWYFAVSDVVEVLTDSVNPTDYIKKMKKRDPELSKGWGPPLPYRLPEVASG